MHLHGQFTWLLIVMFIFCTLTCESENDSKPRQKRDISNSQPRMTSEEGSLIFHTGDLKNIEFRTSSGAIKLNNEDLEEALKQVAMNKNDITLLQINGSGIPQNISSQMDLLSDRLVLLERKIQKIDTILQKRACSSSPCHNGGICVDLLDSFFCLCPNNWNGTSCTVDVDECQIYRGTPLGCQNGAKCTNTAGNYSCQCNPEWYGLQCTSKYDDCQGTSKDLCQHGICIDLDREQPDQPMYECICDAAWEQASGHQACSVDIDECRLLDGPCSKNPPVTCTNTEGSYSCGNCPTGWQGNGHNCQDINECETNNGGCFQNPMVQCLNTMGSFHCGSCPPGYNGDGKVCTIYDICSVNNGGCAANASCTANTGTNFPSCRCHPEYFGNGYGPIGCVLAKDICAKLKPCVNGQCVVGSVSYECTCKLGWFGINCDQNINECASNPCQNGGTCVDDVNGYSCRCTAEWTGLHCQIKQEVCGKMLSGLSGNFSYPDDPGKDQYDLEVSCSWVITTDLDKVLRITFPLFQLENSTNCMSDFLEIRDGDSLSSIKIGRYCDTVIPKEIISFHNSLYLWFFSDHSVVKGGFTVVWESTIPECGGHLDETYGIISSPGYPGNYPSKRDCYWTISVQPDLVITFTFGLLNIENHESCNSDFLEIRDGLQQDDPILQKYCQTVKAPAPLKTTGPSARIHFHSDGSISDRGFNIVYITSLVDTGCGGIHTESEGIIISPNWPNPYPSNVQCVYIIRQPSGEHINLNITHMDLESGNCSLDYVEVRDGDAETDPLIGKFCGSTIPDIITTSGNNLWIKFKSNQSLQKGGFRAVYEVACGGTLNGTGVIQSPYYPNVYPHDKTCIWIINQPEGQVVTLNFVSFDIEDAANCSHDYVEVRDGDAVESVLIGKYCGAGNPPMAQTGRRSMYIKFKTDSSMAKEGFRAEYGTTEKGCGATITVPQGDISSPDHPADYPHGVNCIWYISVQPGNVIRLTFTLFNLEYHENCTKDYIEVYDRGTVNSGKLLGRYCGTSIPPSITSSDNSMSVLFVSDASIATEGFSANYLSIESSKVCTKEFTESTGSFTSPNYPNNYPNLVECIYTITVENNKQIMLNFTDFQLDGYSDYVEIRNGGYETSNLIGTFYETAPQPILSHSNRLWIKFLSNSYSEQRGFVAHWDGTSTGCGGTLQTSTGSFSSPNYPMPYPQNTECYWRIQISAGTIIELEFDTFHLDSSSGCNYDYLTVYDGNSTSSYLLAMLCGNKKPPTIRSTSNNMYIKLRTDSSVGKGGFLARYKSNCQNVTIANHTRGILESINFPENYSPQHTCNWTIQATEGNTIDYSFNAFDLESSFPSCYFAWVKLYDGPNDKSPLIGTFCEQTFPPAGTSNSSSLHVAFSTELTYSSSGFQMLWFQNGCGGDLFGPNGTVTSPGFPNWYPHNRECLWFLHVDGGNSIEFTIHEFDVEYHETCNFDVLEVYGGQDTRSPRLAQLCSTRLPNNPLVISSTGNDITVRFKSNSKGNGKGFKATWKEKPGGCGGIFTSPKGEIHSPNFPSPYGNKVDCSWVITVDSHYRVLLNFTDFDTENRQSCDSAYIAVHDGSNQEAPLIVKICDGMIPGNFTSTSNVMYVHFLSESNVQNKGFRAQFNQVCGSSIITDNIGGVITSPLYPNNYPNNQNCSWIIQAQEPFNHVTLSFTDFATESDGASCSTDALQILDGDNYEAPSIGRYCGATILQPITSESNALVVNFVSNSGKSDKGFRTTYVASTSACGGSYHTETGAFNSPNYPEHYPLNYECVWNLISSPGNRVQLSFISFQIAPSTSCVSDYVEIREGNATGQLHGKLCGASIPNNFTSVTGHILWVKFVSDDSQNDVGFKATFSHLYGNEITGTQGQITSPLWPHHYPNNVRYHWTITAPEGNIIHVKILVMDIDDRSTCARDRLRFYDGPDLNSRLIVTYCGYEPPPPLVSFGNTMTIEFSSDDSNNGQGFILEWHAQEYTVNPTAIPTLPPGACGGNVMTGESPGFLFSPGWPDEYQTHLDCMWVIWAPGSTVELNIMALDIESSDSKCSLDSLVIRDGDDNLSPELTTLCGKELPGPIRSTGEAMFIRFTADAANSGGGFNASYHKTCGGLLHADRGVITSPNYSEHYTANLNCTWHVFSTHGSIISLHFEKLFQVQGSGTNCSKGDYVEFRNGYDASSPPLTSSGGNGRYCGVTPPSTIRTTDNQLFVRFISDGNTQGQGFKFTYEASYMACGATIYVSDSDPVGNISSMNYPNNYPKNIDCVWTIIVPDGEAVQLDFEDPFHIEPESECTSDYLELHDGSSSNSPLISRLCGSTSPSTQKSTGSTMHVRFRTDAKETYIGFKARYSIARCGGTLNAIDGSLQSPGYPSSNYPDNVECEWYLEGPTGHYLTINFEFLELEDSSNCIKDFVEIHEYNSTGQVLGKHCGKNPQLTPMETSDSFAYVRFHADASINMKGFRLGFEASIDECGGERTTSTGTITSPNYPNLYPHSRRCVWKITVQEGRRVTLTIEDLRLEAHENCNLDFVAIYNGLQPNSPMLQKYCGNLNSSVQVMSSGNTMQVVFGTDAAVSNRGFRATYTSEEDAVCGGTLSNPNGGTFTSPGYDGTLNYMSNLNCEWFIKNPSATDSSIYIEFINFHLEHHSLCEQDHIALRSEDSAGELFAKLCGELTPGLSLVIANPQVWVHFMSNPSVEDIGFAAKYTFTACGGIQTGSNGIISISNSPSPSVASTHCAWLLEAPEGYTISLNFTYFELDPHSACTEDSVTIKNGGSSSSPIIGQYCGTNTPGTIKSGSNRLLVIFNSNSTVPYKGFSATWTSDSAGCGGILHADNGSFKSPNWPANFPLNSECTWKVVAHGSQHLELSFDDNFQIPDNGGQCADSYVKVWAGDTELDEMLLTTACGNVPPSLVVAPANVMTARFRSTDSVGKGFFASFTNRCGANFTALNGLIMSPNYPYNYDNNLNCEYFINASMDTFVIVQFEAFAMEDYISCEDALEIYSITIETGEAKSLATHCGSKLPATISVLGPTLLTFQTNNVITDVGFLAKYHLVSCGGTFRESSGIVSSPTYSYTEYHHNIMCTYHIIVQENRLIQLKFSDLDLEFTCSDYVAVYDGSDSSAPSLGKFCGSVVPPPLLSSSNSMFIVFKTDILLNGRGWKAFYIETLGPNQGCGGYLNDTSGTFSSPDIEFDGKYEKNLDCKWTISAPDVHFINITFTAFQLEAPTSGGCHDYLSIYDGRNQSSKLIGTYCGSQLPSSVVSTYNFLTVIFFSDASTELAGFNVTYMVHKYLCGGELKANGTSQIITSPDYPNEYPPLIICHWIIDAPENEQVKVVIQELVLPAPPNCILDYLEIRDSPLDDYGQNFRLCGSDLIIPDFYSYGRKAMIDFYSKEYQNGNKLHLTYQTTGCSREYNQSSGYLKSPGWPDKYPNNLNCKIILRAPENYKISLFFESFSLEIQSNCNNDYLEVYSGAQGHELAIGKFCGNTLPNPISSHSHEVTLIFKTDTSASYDGFEITWTSSPNDCGGTLYGPSGSFYSPNYPNTYYSSTDCEWIIQAPVGRVVTLNILELSIHGNCKKAYLSFYNGVNSNSPLLRSFCEMETSATFTSSSSSVFVKFHAEEAVLISKFKILWTS